MQLTWRPLIHPHPHRGLAVHVNVYHYRYHRLHLQSMAMWHHLLVV